MKEFVIKYIIQGPMDLRMATFFISVSYAIIFFRADSTPLKIISAIVSIIFAVAFIHAVRNGIGDYGYEDEKPEEQ